MKASLQVLLAAFFVCAVAASARAQTAPCCSITAINAATGVISGKVNASGAAFQFKVTNANVLKGLRVGQGVYANLTAKQVSLDGKTSCCTIVSTAAPIPVPPPVTTSIPGSATPSNTGPCCSVTAVGSPSLITARTSAGAYFVFSLNPPANLLVPLPQSTVTVNQKFYANFTTKQVSLNGTSAVGTIQYLCVVPSQPPCPTGAATCKSQIIIPGVGCPSQTVQTSTPASCQSGYYGSSCQPCPPCQSPGVCEDGIAGTGTCVDIKQ